VQGGKLTGLRIVFFAVADAPVLDAALNAQAQDAFNRGADSEVADLAARALAAHALRADLYNQAATKAHLCGVLAARALTELATS
jgi:CO/xanthine dehydrogenase FAD-binding subunit